MSVSTQSKAEDLNFNYMNIGIDRENQNISKPISYSNGAGDSMELSKQTVNVECGGSIINPEPCPSPIDVTVEGCKDAVKVMLSETRIQSLGRVVQVDIPIKNVCPNKRAAAAVILTEVDSCGAEHARGMKTILIPQLSGKQCRDVVLRCVSFVLPEELDTSGNTDSICNDRKFKVRAFANYIDTDFNCCEPDTVIIKD